MTFIRGFHGEIDASARALRLYLLVQAGRLVGLLKVGSKHLYYWVRLARLSLVAIRPS